MVQTQPQLLQSELPTDSPGLHIDPSVLKSLVFKHRIEDTSMAESPKCQNGIQVRINLDDLTASVFQAN